MIPPPPPPPLERRSSCRNIGKQKPYYGSSPEKMKSKPVPKRAKISKNMEKPQPAAAKKDLIQMIDDKAPSDLVPKPPPKIIIHCSSVMEGGGIAEGMMVNGSSSSSDLGGKSAHQRVKETIRLFTKHYLHFVQEEELRCKRVEAVDKTTGKGAKSKKGNSGEEDTKGKAKRPDLKAITKMMETETILYQKKRFGELPGVDVGHQFYSRAEMVVVGLHSHWLNGIDFMGQAYKKLEEFKRHDYEFPLATSIVLSGIYEDDLDNSEDVVYTGQGGNNLLGDKHQMSDQVMLRGNLALKNNMTHSVPVRVIRGHACAHSYTGKVYTYDGLYKVIQYWAEKGVSGFTVFKYRLRRIEGQAVLTTNQVQYVRAEAPKTLSELRGLVCDDISGGQENLMIPASNLVDDPPVPPTDYVYSKSVQVAEGVTLPKIATGCNCVGGCIDPRVCACAQLNGSDFPYVHKDGGRLIEAKSVVFECGPKCKCGPKCVNRTSQQGIKYRLEVFRTSNKGWAVRSWDFIPAGAPICEYTGLLMRSSDLEYEAENNYIFEIDCLQTMKGLDGRESRPGVVPESTTAHSDVPEYSIDAGKVGGIARFINHSCEPNLFVQCVLNSHHDIKLARVMLFAADSIPPLQELTYDYGYVLDSVMDADGNIKSMPCYCGSKNCRKRLF
ncbi:[histone H3]-lysine(4) N-trimethyltransferase [Ranunculus cassubicifolius]